MSHRLIVTASLSLAGALAVPIAAAAMRADGAAGSRSRTTVAPSTPTTVLPAVGGDAVAVRVPSIVMIRVDAHGQVLAVATNSGRAPRRGDLVYLYGPDGSVRPTTATRYLHRQWRGDFRVPAAFQPQTHG